MYMTHLHVHMIPGNEKHTWSEKHMHDVWEEIRKHEACGVVYLQNKKWKVSWSSKSIDLGFN